MLERMETVIEADNLVRRYGAFTAVNALSFSVHTGEVYGLLGTNGAGKTSTLEVLEGLALPDAGTVRIAGMDPFRQRAKVRPHLGIMLQSGGLPQTLTVKESMAMWAGTCSTARHIDEVLDEVELAHRRSVKVGALSGGEQRRLDLACALLGNPKVLFLDEPTTGLDPESRRRVWDLLEKLKASGVTMILTTHYLEEAERLCDRIAIMHAGRIELEGTLDELASQQPAYLRYRHEGQLHEIPTHNLQADCLKLLSWAANNDITLQEFSAQPASLEQVFMSIADKENAR